ncbi:diguanylate cyclase [Mesorhizobium sp. Root157]|uniref:GGDEF domain-containing protein n=1 Tax=Mesorhizobium sp. Root157 TaxID=1736477 RepID=UPI0006F32761|nr:GGDEF domain-containing protein [Mesorhizobium sp. Root157]KRA00180.1 diguanylate cyclase [Mesorhizobium sp. Root157]
MDTSLFIALLNPAIALVLSAAFVGLWFYLRQRHLALLAAGYGLSAVGFVLQSFPFPTGFGITRALAGATFSLAACLVGAAVVLRFGRSRSFPIIGVLAALGFTAQMWFMFVDADLTRRILSLNFAFGAICLLVAADLWPSRARSMAEYFLFGMAILTAMNFIVRPPVVMAIYGPISPENFYNSVYWRSAMLSHALFALLISLCVFAAAALDMVSGLRQVSQTDSLSGLLNRRGFDLAAQRLLGQCGTSKCPVTLVLADLDHFKSINDRYGHAVGDRVIAAFAEKLQAAASGARGVAGRIGGEEFAVLLPWADLAGARLLAEAVRVLFSTGDTEGFPHGLRVTASFGVAARTGDEQLDLLMRRADEALYKAKQNGRNSVRMSYERSVEVLPAASANR